MNPEKSGVYPIIIGKRILGFLEAVDNIEEVDIELIIEKYFK